MDHCFCAKTLLRCTETLQQSEIDVLRHYCNGLEFGLESDEVIRGLTNLSLIQLNSACGKVGLPDVAMECRDHIAERTNHMSSSFKLKPIYSSDSSTSFNAVFGTHETLIPY